MGFDSSQEHIFLEEQILDLFVLRNKYGICLFSRTNCSSAPCDQYVSFNYIYIVKYIYKLFNYLTNCLTIYVNIYIYKYMFVLRKAMSQNDLQISLCKITMFVRWQTIKMAKRSVRKHKEIRQDDRGKVDGGKIEEIKRLEQPNMNLWVNSN